MVDENTAVQMDYTGDVITYGRQGEEAVTTMMQAPGKDDQRGQQGSSGQTSKPVTPQGGSGTATPRK